VFYPSYFFLSCYGEQRENGEQRERTEAKNGEERESRGKKIEERENIGQNERQRKKKKLKYAGKKFVYKVYNSFSQMKSYCSTLGFFFAFEARNRLGLEQLSPFSSSDVEIERTFTVVLEML
jgi:hypothetical protein